MSAYYDYVLAAIPLALLSGVMASVVSPFPLTTTIPFSGTFAVLLIGHALFVRSPVSPPTSSATSVGAEETGFAMPEAGPNAD